MSLAFMGGPEARRNLPTDLALRMARWTSSCCVTPTECKSIALQALIRDTLNNIAAESAAIHKTCKSITK